MNTQDLTAQYLLGNYGRFPVALSRGEGAYVWDESGKRYLDFAAGIAVCALGHCPDAISRVLREQGEKLIHCSNLYHIREQAELAQFAVETMVQRPGKVFFSNSGAEANDGLIKLARKRAYDRHGVGTEKNVIVTCQRSFHGRTLGGIAATGQDKVKIGFDPMLPGFLHIPFNDVEVLREAVNEKTAAVMLEPVQGEGGINTATPEFLAAASELCQELDALLLFDEVQCGSGRTGDWCGWRSILDGTGVDVEPDAVSWAKGFGGGFPIGAFWASDEVAGALGPGTHGSTYGGSPLASAVALSVLKEIESGDVLANVKRQEATIKAAVAEWDHPLVKAFRGVGLMLGFELDSKAMLAKADVAESGKTPSIYVVSQAMERGLLTVPAGENVVRWLPRLNVTDDEVSEALELMKATLDVIEEP